MAQKFKILVTPPTTAANKSPAKIWEFNNTTDNTLSVECERKRDKKKISNITVVLHDPNGDVFAALPDPAFNDIPLQFFMAPPEAPTGTPYEIFDGKITSMSFGYPGPERLTLVAHDRSVDLRRKKAYRTVRGQTSVQVAKNIAKEYGYEVSVDLGTVLPISRSELAPGVTDWELLSRMLNYDGLELFMHKKTLMIRQAAKQPYQLVFTRGQPPLISLEVTINHVGKGGSSGDKKGNTPFDSNGQVLATTDREERAVLDPMKASERSDRGPIGSPPSSKHGSHADSLSNVAWTNQITQLKRRKDTCTITCTAIPDIGLQHVVTIMGYGAKTDGAWYIESIHDNLIGASIAQTVLALTRALSAGGAKTAGANGSPFDRNTT